MKKLIEQIVGDKIIAILRNVPDEHLLTVVGTLLDNGIRCIEVTLNSAGALGQIARLADGFEDRILLGAGTVTRKEDVIQAVEAGATYLITPYVLSEEAAAAAQGYGVPVIMGAMTPTEIARAMELGAALVKVFPIGSLGPGYLKDVLAPIQDARLVAVGGVTPGNIGDYLRSGAVGAGVGGSLVNNKQFSEPGWETRLAERARLYVQAIKDVK
jgi:2-dehydro-3-deoxyphosphogluconate aldolase/(4S)-4-hydroxy-2-oxoglutarate aldolase